ncbi:Serine/threonine protein kinase [Gracilaria domingensis]|nr:Serine/threonine protein kinase [Gracilaria domingensis]
MKGWLATREGLLRTQRYFFRLQWGFLSQHLTETSAAIVRYFVHGSRIHIARVGLRVVIELGVLGMAFAAQQGTAARVVLIADDAYVFQRWVTCLYRAKNRDVRRWYHLGDTLGRGVDGIVMLGTAVENGHLVAVKRIRLLTLSTSIGEKLRHVMREIQLQHKAAKRSANVAAVLDVFYDDEFCYMVMQYGNKGSLCELLAVRDGFLGEAFVRNVAIQLGKCLLSMHQSNLVHRDIKCDNVLIAHSQRTPLQVLVCDFGFATVWRPELKKPIMSFCREPLGTEAYFAPELLRGEAYGAPVDIFALGVLCHVCLTGFFPFESFSRQRTLRKIESGYLPNLDRAQISEEAKSFTRTLLNKDPYKRPPAVALLQHRWIRGGREQVRTQLRVAPSAVWRRLFHVVTATRAMQRLGQRARTATYQSMGVSFRASSARRRIGANHQRNTRVSKSPDMERSRIRSDTYERRLPFAESRRERTAD